MEYATAVWDPYRQKQTDLIEAVQQHTARFIKRDYNRTSSVTKMLQSLDLDILEDRRKAHRLNIFYLAVNNSIALPVPISYLNSVLLDHLLYLIIPYLNSILLDHFLKIHLFKPTSIMIIIFIFSFEGE